MIWLLKLIISLREKLIIDKRDKYDSKNFDSFEVIAPQYLQEKIYKKLEFVRREYCHFFAYLLMSRYLRGFVYEGNEYNIRKPPLTPWILINDAVLDVEDDIFFYYLVKRALMLRCLNFGIHSGWIFKWEYKKRITEIADKLTDMNIRFNE